MTIIAGVDEVGRGPLAGPVISVAVILNKKKIIRGLRDSKKLTADKRQVFNDLILARCLAWAYGFATVKEIDKLNILNASLLSMKRAVQRLSIVPERVLVDGNKCPDLSIESEAIIGGDDTVAEISAASIVAKVMRDYLMTIFDKKYPKYGFAQHKGYATAVHMAALAKHGISPIHRLSFEPVRNAALL
jgi:ribonuclease HII